MSDNVLSWRITSEEVERKIPKGTPYDMVVEAFGTPMREVNFRFGNRLLTYFSKTNLIASNTYYGFSVYLTNNRVANLLFNRDQYSPPQ